MKRHGDKNECRSFEELNVFWYNETQGECERIGLRTAEYVDEAEK